MIKVTHYPWPKKRKDRAKFVQDILEKHKIIKCKKPEDFDIKAFYERIKATKEE